MIFQNPMTSLNPTLTIGYQLAEPLLLHEKLGKTAARQKAAKLLELVGIPDGRNRLNDYPHQFSGGQRQRIVTAIALACNPEILIADEPTTALDVTIQAQILALFKDIQKQADTSIIFITHDLGVVANVADRVAVVYGGKIVEPAWRRKFSIIPSTLTPGGFFVPCRRWTPKTRSCTPSREVRRICWTRHRETRLPREIRMR
ncbi:hypothetical protein HMSSN139_06870 [Paenibacillus sp. HMSSN-139]|nr:hypothetical protein HMSSN139_06870 [Paenibacillus sp. HMSSN-139]